MSEQRASNPPLDEQILGSESTAVAQVTSLVEALGSVRRGPTLQNLPDQMKTISITGERGVGKSTVLRFTCESLKGRHLVMPIIDPARFATGDSLIAWVLAELRRILPDESLTSETASGAVVQRTLMELSRSEALASSHYAAGLSARGLSPEEFGRDASSVTLRRAEFLELWSELLEAVMSIGSLSGRQLVIPIDDADLHPGSLSSLLADMEMLTSSDFVTILFASDEETLRRSILLSSLTGTVEESRLALSAGLVTASSFEVLADRRMAKHFPRAYRVDLLPLRTRELLDFTPIGKNTSLGDLLDTVPLTNAPGRSVLDFFVVRHANGKRAAESELVRCLPSNRREIRDLYDSIEFIRSGPRAAGQVLRQIIERATTNTRVELDQNGSPLVKFDHDEGSDGSLSATLNLEGMTGGRTSSSAQNIYRAAPGTPPAATSESVYCRTVDEYYLIREPKTASSAPDSSGESQNAAALRSRVPTRAAHAVFLAWDSSQDSDYWGHSFNFRGFTGRPITTPGLRNWRDQVFPGSAGNDESFCYWTIPNWDQWHRYFSFTEAWNRLRSYAADAGAWNSRPELLEALLLAHVETVATLQLYDSIPNWLSSEGPNGVDRLQLETWNDTAFRVRQQEVAALVVSASQLDASTSPGLSDYLEWAVAGLTLISIRSCNTDRVSRWALELRDALDVAQEYRDRASNVLYSEINAHISNERAKAEIESFQTLDADRAQSLLTIHEAVSNNIAAERNHMVKTLTEGGVPSNLVSRLERDGSSPELLSALAALNWSPSSLVAISKAFPSKQLREIPTTEADV